MTGKSNTLASLSDLVAKAAELGFNDTPLAQGLRWAERNCFGVLVAISTGLSSAKW